MKRKRRSRQFKNSSRVIDMEEARKQRREKREKENEAKAFAGEPQFERSQKRKRALRQKQALRRIILIVIAVVILALIGVSVTKIILLKKEQNIVMKKQEQLLEEKKEKEKELKNIDSLENLEEQARRLKLIKPGESLYIPKEKEDK